MFNKISSFFYYSNSYIIYPFYCFFESIICLPFFLLKKNIWKNKIILPFFHWSFGHSISGNDVICRLFNPTRISILVINSKSTNKYLFACFHKNADIFFYYGFFSTNNRVILNNRFFYLKFTLQILNTFFYNKEIINDFHNYYNINPYVSNEVFYGNEENGKKYLVTNFSGYAKLIQENIGNNLSLPDTLKDKAKQIILKKFPKFFEKKFVTVLFRKKGIDSDFSSKIRNTNPENYTLGLNHLINFDINVAIIGDYNNLKIANNINIFNFTDIQEYELINIYLITNCYFFIGQQSGPYLLANSSKIPCLLIDSFPYKNGSYNKHDINLFKKIIKNEKELSLLEIFNTYSEILIGYKLKENNLTIEDNTENEIFLSIKEMYLNLNNEEFYNKKKKKYLEIIDNCPDDILLKYCLSTIPMFKM